MPSPIAHTLAGVAVYQAFPVSRQRWGLLAMLLVAANLPDLDFIPGLLLGNADRFHHGPSHSLLVGLTLGLMVGGVVAGRAGAAAGRCYGLALAAAYASHVILDMFCIDTRPPFGVPLVWPLSNIYLASPVELFMDINRDRDTAAFFGSLFQTHNLWAALWELGLMSGVVGLAWLVRHRRHRPPVAHDLPADQMEV